MTRFALLQDLCDGPPTGRPIFRYAVSDTALQQIATRIRQDAGIYCDVPVPNDTCALFCLYVSTWCRHHHVGRSWSWRKLKIHLDIQDIHDDHLRSCTSRGLRILKRPLQRHPNGARRFLMTLVCEGGLPLQRMAREGTRIRSYFRAVITRFGAMRRTGEEPVETHTEDAESARQHLATSFHNDAIYQLVGELVATLWTLWRRHGHEDGDAVAILDAAVPAWRDRLPIAPPDGIAEMLLHYVVEDITVVQRGDRFQLSVSTLVVNANGQHRLVRRLNVPPSISHHQLQENFPTLPPHAHDAPANRFKLHLTTRSGAVAPAGVLQRSGGQWDVHPTRATPLHGRGISGPITVELVCKRGDIIAGEGISGTGSLGELPWVFRELPDGTLLYVGTGSLSHASAKLWIAATPDQHPAGDAFATEFHVANRRLYRVDGTATLPHDDGIVRIQARTPAQHGTQDKPIGTRRIDLDTGLIKRTTPYPAGVMGFLDGQHQLASPGTAVHLKHLDRYTAISSSPSHEVFLQLKLQTTDPEVPAPLTRRLHPEGPLHRLSLREARGLAERLLGMTDDLDATIHLTLYAPGARPADAPTLIAQRYDWTLEPHHEHSHIELSEELSAEALDEIEVVARPLQQIDQRVPLRRVYAAPNAGPTWDFEPESQAPGVHLVTVCHDGWHRCRPLLMWGGGTAAQPSHSLAAALELANQSDREPALDDALRALASDLDHADWPLLMRFFELLGDVPAATFDVLRALRRTPNALAAVGLQLANLPVETMLRAWDGLEDFLFLWETVPMESWWHAMGQLQDHLHNQAPQLAIDVLHARIDRLTAELPTLPMFFAHWAKRTDVPIDLDRLGQARCTLESNVVPVILAQRDAHLRQVISRNIDRDPTTAPWPTPRGAWPLQLPDAFEVKVDTPHRHAPRALIAPTVLAWSVVLNQPLDRATIMYLMELRCFDEDLFRQGLTLATEAVLAHTQWRTR